MRNQDHNQYQGMPNKSLSFSILLGQDDDVPHPRHLCFRYPFAKTSPKKHCKKCYCYVCEQVAPCKKWNKPAKGHCRATDDEIWKSERESRKRVSATKMTMAHHRLTVSFMHYPANQTVLINGFAGGLICDNNRDWVTGFSMEIHNDMGSRDSSVPPYIALLEGLKLGWSQGFRFLDVELGYLYHEGFWQDFVKDSSSGKFYRASPNNRHRVLSVLAEVESCLNQDWFINVKNAPSIKEESGALTMAMMAKSQPLKQVYNFPSHPLTTMIRDMARNCETSMAPICKINLPADVRGDLFTELKSYVGLN